MHSVIKFDKDCWREWSTCMLYTHVHSIINLMKGYFIWQYSQIDNKNAESEINKSFVVMNQHTGTIIKNKKLKQKSNGRI